MAVHAMGLGALLLVVLASTAAALPASFDHGVASGDPTPSTVIIWTRVEPRSANTSTSGTFAVNWYVSLHKDLSSSVASGVFNTSADRDFTVKVDVTTGLQPGKQYFYGFTVSGVDSVGGASVSFTVRSPVGTFRLPYPEGSDKQKSLKYAVFSCSNWGWGYFNVYDAASRYDLDFWVHLGDYLYEYGLLSYPSPTQAVRWQDPGVGGLSPGDEIITLSDYRKRHALYRQDAGLQALSAKAALVSIWDDHETTNNARISSGEDHQTPTEGDYQVRKAIARKVYYEWMPIREIENGQYIDFKINKTLSFGNLAKVYLLEERLTGRSDEPVPSDSQDESTNRYPAPSVSVRVGAVVDNKTDSSYSASEVAALQAVKAFSDGIKNQAINTIIGSEQMAWIREETLKSKAAGITWNLYQHGTVMLDLYSDFEAAIAKAKTINPARAALWEKLYNAIAYGQGEQTTKSYGIQCYNRPYLGKTLNITSSMRSSVRRNQAAGRFQILTGFDAWPGYQRERDEFLSIAALGNNPVQYGGDSHADWAGMQSVNGEPTVAEFDVGSVTSPSSENGAFLPLDLLNAALVAGSSKTGLRYAGIGNKGFLYVELDSKVHHAEYIHVDTWCQPQYKATCDYAFDYYADSERADNMQAKGRKEGKGRNGNNGNHGNNKPKDLMPSKCGRVPDLAPYSVINTLNILPGQQASNVP